MMLEAAGRTRRGWWFVVGAVALVMGMVAMAISPTIAQGAPGNNGTVKIHDAETDEELRRNEPHVCEFYIVGFGFDAGQEGEWEIDGHPPTAWNSGLSGGWVADSEGFWRSDDIDSLEDGHYKLTLTTNQPGGKKHKVFWVDCPDEGEDEEDEDENGEDEENGEAGVTGVPQAGGAAPVNDGMPRQLPWLLGMGAALFGSGFWAFRWMTNK